MTSTSQQTLSTATASRWGRVGMVLFVGMMLALIVLGILYRNWAWDYTSPGRYRFDINRNYDFGSQVLDGGYLNLYENQVRDDPPYERKIDYPPLRLATFAGWAAWTRWMDPAARQWQESFAFNGFLIYYNTTMGLLGAIAAFLIVRHWLRVCATCRAGPPIPPALEATEPSQTLSAGSRWTGILPATIAFTMLWFDPGVAIIGHGWPSPNLWVVPMYLWAVYFCLAECWFIAGLVLGIGAMMQGQQLLVAAAFIGWPVLAGQPLRAIRWLSGFTFAFGIVVSGWMLTLRPDINANARIMNWPAVLWVCGTVLLVTLTASLAMRNRRIAFAIALLALVAMVYPAFRSQSGALVVLTSAALGLALLVGIWFASWRTRLQLLALTTGLCLLSCMLFWGGSTAWWKIGFMYGTERFQNVGGYQLVSNFASLLSPMLGWDNVHQIAFEIPKPLLVGLTATPVPVEVRHVLLVLFGVLMLVAMIAMARHWRRKDPALLVALVLPWVLFYTILPQMSPRYAVFVAGVSVICIGRSLALIPAVWLFSFLTLEQTALCMMYGNQLYGGVEGSMLFAPGRRELYESLNPGLSWPVIIAAGTLLFMALRGTPRPALAPCRKPEPSA